MLLCCGAWQYRAVNVRVTVLQTCYCAVGPGNIGLLMLVTVLQLLCCGAWQYRAVNVRVTVLQTCYCAVGPGNIGLLILEPLYYRHTTVLWGLAI